MNNTICGVPVHVLLCNGICPEVGWLRNLWMNTKGATDPETVSRRVPWIVFGALFLGIGLSVVVVYFVDGRYLAESGTHSPTISLFCLSFLINLAMMILAFCRVARMTQFCSLMNWLDRGLKKASFSGDEGLVLLRGKRAAEMVPVVGQALVALARQMAKYDESVHLNQDPERAELAHVVTGLFSAARGLGLNDLGHGQPKMCEFTEYLALGKEAQRTGRSENDPEWPMRLRSDNPPTPPVSGGPGDSGSAPAGVAVPAAG